jgi:[ribosomal protein S18]-alanine N-acetyltransferase
MAGSSSQFVRFSPEWSTVVTTWATTSDEVLSWCSGAEAPVAATTIAAWGNEDNVDAYGVFDGDRLIAYGEVWIDHDEAEAELARIIVAPDRRQTGVGRELTRLLTARAREAYPDVYLRVRPGNEVAVKCYGAAGFVRLGSQEEKRFNVGQPVEYVWMRSESTPQRDA